MDKTKVRNKIVEAATKLLDKQSEEAKIAKSNPGGVQEAVQMILKEISSADWHAGAGTGQFVERQHLDAQIGDITDRMTPFLDRVAKTQANGKTHEWDMIVALGSNDTAVEECGTPAENEATIKRFSAQIKTYATRVKVCDLAQWAASDYVNLSDTHLAAGMKKILQDLEKKVYYGNFDGSDDINITGLYRLINQFAPSNVEDASGGTITLELIDDAINSIVDEGGMPTHIFMGAKDLRDFASLWSNKVVFNDPSNGMTFGYNVARYMSFAGPVDIVMDPFLTAANSPDTHTGSDVFITTMNQVGLAQSEPMYKLPTYRGLDLAETETVVWNVALECRVPAWQAVIKDLG